LVKNTNSFIQEESSDGKANKKAANPEAHTCKHSGPKDRKILDAKQKFGITLHKTKLIKEKKSSSKEKDDRSVRNTNKSVKSVKSLRSFRSSKNYQSE